MVNSMLTDHSNRPTCNSRHQSNHIPAAITLKADPTSIPLNVHLSLLTIHGGHSNMINCHSEAQGLAMTQ
jgi:hypothetical protein